MYLIPSLLKRLFNKRSNSILANADFSYLEEIKNDRKNLKKNTKGYRKQYNTARIKSMKDDDIKTEIELHGCVEVPEGISPDDFFDELVNFLESRGSNFGGYYDKQEIKY